MYDIKSRATLAEFIVAQALNIKNLSGIEWDLYDINYNGHKIAVRSPEDAVDVMFDISPSERLGARASDLHIFTMFNGEDGADPYNVTLWRFWVLSTPNINRTFDAQETVSLGLIQPIAIQTNYEGLQSAVDMVAA